ncbi:hypothetical protein ACU4GA_30515 [Methylobacterium oryzae CBMB20]
MTRLLASPAHRLAALGLGLLVVNVGVLAIHVPGADTVGSVTRANVFVGVVAVGLVPYLLAVRLVLRQRLPRAALWTILGIAVLMRAALLPAPPFLSSDIYRYVWDGQVHAAGINPYRYVPADPALERLRDAAVYPLINRKDYARTIYPPAAQAGLRRRRAGLARRHRDEAGDAGLRGPGHAGDARDPARRRPAVAPHPDLRLESARPVVLRLRRACRCGRHRPPRPRAAGPHPPSVRARGRAARRGHTGEALPVAVAPAFVRRGRLWRPMLVGAAVIVVLYLPYLGAGANVLGFAGGYGAEEGYETGAGYWLLAGLGHLGLAPRACCGPIWSAPA